MKVTSANYVSCVLRSESCNFSEIEERTYPMLRLLHSAMGINTESGELMDQLKKHVFYGKPFDETNAVEELGDLMWYVGLACDVIGVTLDEVLQRNIDKLRVRYPEKFTEINAIERDLDAERKTLERETMDLDAIEAVHELEEAVSDAESRANERGRTINWLRELCGEADGWIGELDRRGDYIDERWRLRAAAKGGAT